MAQAYYYKYNDSKVFKDNAKELFKTPTVEADIMGGVFTKCVYDTLQEYGIRVDQNLQYKQELYHDNHRFRAFIMYRDKDGLLLGDDDDRIDIALTTDNKLIVDFKVDPLIPDATNDDIARDIGEKAKEGYLTEDPAPIETESANRYNKLSMDRRHGGCYIATAVYGSYDCPEVWTLRRFRDFYLAKNLCGRIFIKAYYAASPVLVKSFGNTGWFKSFWKDRLDRLVACLKAKGYKDDPYND